MMDVKTLSGAAELYREGPHARSTRRGAPVAAPEAAEKTGAFCELLSANTTTGREGEVLVYGAELEHNPLDQPDADWPARQTGRGTHPQALASWQAFFAD